MKGGHNLLDSNWESRFPPLHTDNNHPVKNKEACAWYSIVDDEKDNSKGKIKFLCFISLENKLTHTLTSFHVVLHKEMNVISFLQHSTNQFCRGKHTLSVQLRTMEFSLNGAELSLNSLNSRNSENLRNQWSFL